MDAAFPVQYRAGQNPENLMKILLTLLLICTAGLVHADDSAVRQNLAEKFDVAITDVRLSPLAGIYELRAGTNIVYVSADGKYLLQGDLIDVDGQRNLTEAERRQARLDLLAGVGSDQMISFPAPNEEHVITVFTDIDCTYCRKLHSEMAELNTRGISVHYLFYPRAGVGSSSWKKAQEVWCARDQRQAITLAKQGLPVNSQNCSSDPVLEDYKLGQLMGVSGTPTIITDTGQLIGGYLPVARMAQVLNQDKAAQ